LGETRRADQQKSKDDNERVFKSPHVAANSIKRDAPLSGGQMQSGTNTV
jgi:hypothetical protein